MIEQCIGILILGFLAMAANVFLYVLFRVLEEDDDGKDRQDGKNHRNDHFA